VNNVPLPTTVLIVPATIPAAKMPSAWSAVSGQPSVGGASTDLGRRDVLAPSNESNQTGVRGSVGPFPTDGGAVKLSARNKLDGTVTSIHRGEAIANVILDVGGQRLVASITVEAVDDLGLAEGVSVSAIVKASDVIIAIDD
jgi:molybdopterin-binding protein